jgi:hypothetical protein
MRQKQQIVESLKTRRREDRIAMIVQAGLAVAGGLGLIWLLITIVRWLWEHPLF